MTLYFTIFRLKLAQQLQYRGDFLLGIFGDFLSVYIQLSIWRALLTSGWSGIPLEQMITYTIVAFILRQFTRVRFSANMSEKVVSGSIAMDFIRPINLRGYMFAEQLSQSVLTFLTSAIPMLIVSSLFWGMLPPAGIMNGILFAVSAIFAVILMYLLDYTVSLAVFWLKNGVHTRILLNGLFTIFSGTTIPLWFYPEWLARICKALPFQLVTFAPGQIYLGRVDTREALVTIFSQLLWILLISAAHRFVWFKAQKLVIVQGG